ncbi:MAG: calcium/sodium antiporter [Pseudomonadales bacterium]|nr:calcium/sodium antiporter [Pseudomonadales bacterium]
MLFASLAILVGFLLLIWSADRFVDGAAATAKHLGMPSLLIGIVIVGFGTSAPEMVVSAMAALDGNPELALGNALGSNIVNTGLILGITALLIPLTVHSGIVRKELPMLLGISLLLGLFLLDNNIQRWEAIILLTGFFSVIGWSIFSAMRAPAPSVEDDHLQTEVDEVLEENTMTLKQGVLWLIVGLALMVVSSRMLASGAVTIAEGLGVSSLIIGLTIVALGTSLPELAASIAAARKGEHDIAIGNVVGSNMFNILAVVGIAAVISPLHPVPSEVLTRDWPVMMGLTLALLAMAYGFKREGRINRVEASLLLIAFTAYSSYLVYSATQSVPLIS